jgi:cyanophycinase-like exopeptidase
MELRRFLHEHSDLSRIPQRPCTRRRNRREFGRSDHPGDYLVRGAVSSETLMMTPEPEHEHGFKFLRKSAIDQHLNTRNRWDDLLPVTKKHPEFLGIGLSEGTAIIVNKHVFEVMGKWKVAIWDNTHPRQPWEKPFFILSAGDIYNMKTRTIEKYGIGNQTPVTVGSKN